MKLRPLGAELFHVDGRTDRHDEGILWTRLTTISSSFLIQLSNIHKLSLPTFCTEFIIYCSYIFRSQDMAIFRDTVY